MGKKKVRGTHNDFLDGEKLRDNTDVRNTLQDSAFVASPAASSTSNRVQTFKPQSTKAKNGSKKPTLTHFLCLPLVTESSRPLLQTRLQDLKRDLQRDGLVPTKAVRPVGTLHLTLGVMSLDADSLEQASIFLHDLDLYRLLRDVSHRKLAEKAAEEGAISENLIAANMPDTDALSVDLENLIPMQAAHNTSILYAEPKDVSARLFPFALAIKERFEEKGFLNKDNRPLKLHATILNTIYAKPEGKGRNRDVKNAAQNSSKDVPQHRNNQSATGNDESGSETEQKERMQGHGPEAKSWVRFDASKLIERYKGFVWAQNIRVDRVQICEMGAKKIWSGGKEGDGEILDQQYQVVCEKRIFE